MLIPVTTDSIVLVDIISRLDGIILIGGADIHPSYYNEEPIEQLGEVDSLRDVYDISLIRLAAQRGVPMLGLPGRTINQCGIRWHTLSGYSSPTSGYYRAT